MLPSLLGRTAGSVLAESLQGHRRAATPSVGCQDPVVGQGAIVVSEVHPYDCSASVPAQCARGPVPRRSERRTSRLPQHRECCLSNER